MRDFNRDRRGGGRDFKRRDFDRPQEMHKAICSNCGKECEVPFRPTGSKPVFCRECFQNNREGGSSNFQRKGYDDNDRRENSNNRPQQQVNYNEQFNALSQKLDKIINLLSKETKVEKVLVPVQKPKILEEVEEVAKASSPVVKKKKKVKVLPQE